MSQIEDFQKLGVTLDLAVEANQLLRGKANIEVSGVKEQVLTYENSTVTIIDILDERGAQALGKPIGRYITIESPTLGWEQGALEEINRIFSLHFRPLLPQKKDKSILIVGLGNDHATPDALGPAVIDHILATRHILLYAPEAIDKDIRPVCTLAPGVLGSNGIETAEIIRGVCAHVKPACIIAIDALSAASVSRIGSTIQITNTGISPGSGIGNRRADISAGTMGVPVIAIGVPTVVHSAVIVNEAFRILQREWAAQNFLTQEEIEAILSPRCVQSVAHELLMPFSGNLVVTPKEIDEMITNIAGILATVLTCTLHPTLTLENCRDYMQ